MLVNPRTVEIDVTPSNVKVLLGSPTLHASSIKTLADVVHAWVDAALTKSMLGIDAKGVNLGCLQAVTVSCYGPTVTFRLVVDQGNTDAEIEQFRVNCGDALYYAAHTAAQDAWARSLRPEIVDMCKRGPFEVKDLVGYIPLLHSQIIQHGERTVIERCQIARYNCGSAEQAIDCVLAYYRATDEHKRAQSEQARKAMSPEERAVAFTRIGGGMDGSVPAVC